MDTTREMFARLFWHYRNAAGSVSECARRSGYSHGYVSDIEAGRKVPRLDAAADFDQAFGAGGALIEMRRVLAKASREGDTLATESADAMDGMEAGDVERRQLLQALGMTGVAGLAGQLGHVEAVRVTLEDVLDRSVEEWQEVAFDYGRDYLTLPPADLVDELARDVLAVRRLLDRPSSVADRTSLQRVAGQLSALMAMTLGTLGEFDHARRWWRTARTAADRSNDPEFAVWVRARQALVGLYEDRSPGEVVDMADRALARAPATIGIGTMVALAARAQGLALAEDPAAVDTVREVADAYEQLPHAVSTGTSAPVHGWGWGEQQLRHVQSYVSSCTADRHAPDIHDAAAALYPRERRRASTQIELHRAGWMVRTGDASEGLGHATRVVAALPKDGRDRMIETTAQNLVLKPMASRQHDLTAADKLRQALALIPAT